MIKGLKITIEGDRPINKHSSFLDLDEIDSLQQSVTYLQQNIERIQGENEVHTEVVFSTKDNFKIGWYKSSASAKWGYFASSGEISPTICFRNDSFFTDLESDITKALQILNGSK